MGEISTRSNPRSRATRSASNGCITPNCPPSSSITRTSRARIRSLIRVRSACRKFRSAINPPKKKRHPETGSHPVLTAGPRWQIAAGDRLQIIAREEDGTRPGCDAILAPGCRQTEDASGQAVICQPHCRCYRYPVCDSPDLGIKSGRLRRVFSIAFCRRHLATSAWFPPINTSGTFHPRNSAGRV